MFKAVLNSDKPIKWAKTIVAYANGKGGVTSGSYEFCGYMRTPDIIAPHGRILREVQETT